jgi:hypothetical protein
MVMTEPDELSPRLHQVASTIDVGDADVALAAITRTARRRRRRRVGVGVAAVVSVGMAGISVIAWADRSSSPTVLVGLDPSTTPAPVIDSSPPTTGPPPVVTEPPPAPPPAESRIVEPAAGAGTPVDPNPYAAQGMGAGFLVPWRDGFLAGGPSNSDTGSEAHFSSDGISWQPIDIALPDGVYPQRYTVGGDRLVLVGNTPGRSATTVYASSDLVNWSAQTIEPSLPPIGLPDFVKPTVRVAGLVANNDGWIVEASQGVRLDARGFVPAAELPVTDFQSPLAVTPDQNGVTVQPLGDVDSPLQYTWDELGVTPEQSEYIIMADNSGERRWWSATWTGAPVPASGTGVPTAEGFVQVGGSTSFSPDGVDWTRPPTTVPGAAFPVVLPYGDGIVDVDSDGETPILRRLDARGELIEEIVIEGLAPVRIPFSAFPEPSSALVYSSTDVVQPVQSMEHDGYRLTYDPANPVLELVDVATGETIVREDKESFEATGVSSLVWDDAGVTITDPTSGEVIVTFPPDVVQRSMDETSNIVSQFVPDLRLLATADGERFVAVDLPDDAGDGGNYQSVVNGSRALVGINGDWMVYDLP